MRIALDAMGGDFMPHPNVDGAIAALKEHPDVEILLVGDLPVLEPLLAASGFSDPRLKLRAANGFVEMNEKPTDALRRKPNCSIAVCWQMMASREVDAVVSAGHTGAVVAAGLWTRLFLPGVRRPGIAVPIPTVKGISVVMDVGANPAARPEHLVQYGVMGSIYANQIIGIDRPTVGLMNIGSEDGKGNDLVKESQLLFASSGFRDRYVGNVEGRGLYEGEADVVICEGFVGNVMLKVSEGMADLVMRSAAAELKSSLPDSGPAIDQAFQRLAKRFQYHEFGGAPLLGVDGSCVICHGSSNSRSIFNAIRVAKQMVLKRINEAIVKELEEASASRES